MASKYSVQFTQQAYDDLDALLAYMAVEQANQQAAKDFLQHLTKLLNNICTL